VPKPRKYQYNVGDQIGNLTIIGFEMKKRPDGRNRRLIEVACSCGTVRQVYPMNLASGDTRSCGCLQKKKASTANMVHGAKSKNASSTQKRLLSVWRGMRSRCYNKNASNFKWYGEKGIQVEWSGFPEFYAWALEHGYTEGLEIDRVDPTKNYSSANCMWCSKSDNIARAHLKIDNSIKIKATAMAQSANVSFSSIIESALRDFLDARGEVMEYGN
jgi:hypothetical protein